MNCISGSAGKSLSLASPTHRRWALFLALIVVTACGVETSESADDPGTREYNARYLVSIDPESSSVDVSLEIGQPQHMLRELRFTIPPRQIVDIHGDGGLEVDGERVIWRVPPRGGILHWRVHVNHQRENNGYDALLGAEWGIFRAEDVIPRAKTRTLKGSTSRTTLSFDLPRGWSAVTEYSGAEKPITVEREDRRFDEPTGWIVVGNIGVRRETIAGISVAVAAPQGHAVRRLDMLALLNWTLPELVELLPNPPDRLTIVSAGDPMWRGGLSAPASLYIHAERPLISENATSTLLHEVLHSTLSIQAREGYDWIVEGLAEYYGLELLRRGHAISTRRHADAIAKQAEWGRQAKTLCGKYSTGPVTALAVSVLRALDREILDRTSGASNLDDLLRHIVARRSPIDIETLASDAAKLIGDRSDVLHIDQLPGCSKIQSGNQGS